MSNGVDTLAVSQEQVRQIVEADNYLGAYDGTTMPSTSLLEALWERIADALDDLLRSATRTTMGNFWLAVGVLALVVLVVVAILYRKKIMRWLHRDAAVDYEVRDDEDIYGIDFDAEIAAATAAGNHAALVRLYYLKTLRALVDAGRLDWVPGRTPSQYALLANMEPMTSLTNVFLKVRYGKFEAFNEQSTLAAGCCRSVIDQITTGQEGGEPS